MPGVHCQPAWHIWPASQMVPGKHTAEVGQFEPGEVPGGVVPGNVVHAAMHPVSRKARGHARMWFPRNRGQYQTPAKLNLG
jgi:hypothetical protein